MYFILSVTLPSNSQNTAEPLMPVGAMRNECDIACELSCTAKSIYSGDRPRAVLRACIIRGTRPAVYSLPKSFKGHITFLADLGYSSAYRSHLSLLLRCPLRQHRWGGL